MYICLLPAVPHYALCRDDKENIGNPGISITDAISPDSFFNSILFVKNRRIVIVSY